ncbi:MAG: gamma carbonic anhydrase family protein [Ectothiorhodospiraceae bacterium]|nr:gamma carbonic anhydrase family protein [Ectothiorhodospiraceae bacterium]
MIYPYEGKYPNIHPSAFITDNVVIVGDVEIGEQASLWFGTVARGDVHYIKIGARTNVQDNTVLHVTWKKNPLNIGADVTIGHGAMLHGCTVHDAALIGMRSTILDKAVIEPESLIAAGTLVLEKFVVPEGSLVAGVPGRIIRKLSDEERSGIRQSAKNYLHYVDQYKAHGDLDNPLSVSEYFKRYDELPK